MSTRLATRLTLMLVCALAPWPAAAQEVFGGYSYLVDPSASVLQTNANNDALPVGWMAGGAYPIRARWFSAAGEIGGQRKTRSTVDGDVSLSFLSALAGGRASAQIGRVTEFGQVLYGVVRAHGSAFGVDVTTTSAAIQAGGGVDIPLTRQLSARIEVDYRRLQGSSEGRQPAHQFRAVAAFVYHR